jgi:hypothetical protein
MEADITALHLLAPQIATEQTGRMVAHDHAQPQPLGAAYWYLDDAARLLESVTGSTTVGCVNAYDCCCIIANERQHDVGSRTASPRSFNRNGVQPVIEVPVQTPERSYFPGDSDETGRLELAGAATLQACTGASDRSRISRSIVMR